MMAIGALTLVGTEPRPRSGNCRIIYLLPEDACAQLTQFALFRLLDEFEEDLHLPLFFLRTTFLFPKSIRILEKII
jgi:hypothetical protein